MRILGLAALVVGALWAGSASAEEWDVACPNEARGTVTHNGGAEWTATPQSSTVRSVSVERIGGAPALVCRYRLFGQDYVIWRRPPIEVPYCRVMPGSNRLFLCNNGRRD